MTELRQKMIRAMELENLSANTQRRYLAAVTGLAKHYRQSPDQLAKEHRLHHQAGQLEQHAVTRARR